MCTTLTGSNEILTSIRSLRCPIIGFPEFGSSLGRVIFVPHSEPLSHPLISLNDNILSQIYHVLRVNRDKFRTLARVQIQNRGF